MIVGLDISESQQPACTPNPDVIQFTGWEYGYSGDVGRKRVSLVDRQC
jgi:hypothetical protein